MDDDAPKVLPACPVCGAACEDCRAIEEVADAVVDLILRIEEAS